MLSLANGWMGPKTGQSRFYLFGGEGEI